MAKDALTRIFSKCAAGPNSCIVWTGSTDEKGYGHISFMNANRRVHRVVAFAKFGFEAMRGLVARHSCDNPRCCNPNHILKGSQAENLQDAIDRGRRGEPKTIRYVKEKAKRLAP